MFEATLLIRSSTCASQYYKGVWKLARGHYKDIRGGHISGLVFGYHPPLSVLQRQDSLEWPTRISGYNRDWPLHCFSASGWSVYVQGGFIVSDLILKSEFFQMTRLHDLSRLRYLKKIRAIVTPRSFPFKFFLQFFPTCGFDLLLFPIIVETSTRSAPWH